MKRIILIIFSSVLVLNCNSQSKENDKNQKELVKDSNNLNMELEILNKTLKNQNYIALSRNEFLDRIKLYFGINYKDSEYEQSIGKNNYGLDFRNQFMNTFPESIFYNSNETDQVLTKEQVLNEMGNLSNYSVAKFIAYNKLLFNDDKLSILFFKQNIDDANEIVIDFAYEGDEDLIKMVINKMNLDNFDEQSYKSVLLNNNDQVRKNFIGRILKLKGSQFLYDITYGFLENIDKYKSSTNSKENALLYVLNNLERNKVNVTEDLTYNLIALLDKKEKNLVTQIRKNINSNNEVKNIIDSYYINKESGDPNDDRPILGYIKDVDGYVNVRESLDKKSKIIGRLKNNEKVYVIPSDQAMWKIENVNGSTSGYVHKSRIIINED